MSFLDNLIEHFIRINRRMKRWKGMVSVLSAAIVFITTYALILPAITLDKDTAQQLHELFAEAAPCFFGLYFGFGVQGISPLLTPVQCFTPLLQKRSVRITEDCSGRELRATTTTSSPIGRSGSAAA